MSDWKTERDPAEVEAAARRNVLAQARLTQAKWRSYLPMDCPLCSRRRLEYRTNADGDVVEVKCEKCGASSEWDAFSQDGADVK